MAGNVMFWIEMVFNLSLAMTMRWDWNEDKCNESYYLECSEIFLIEFWNKS